MNQVNQFIRGVESLYDLLEPDKKPCVTVLGSFNSGKSTLVNGLLGVEVSPVGVVPTTDCLVILDYGRVFRARYNGIRQNLSFEHMEQLHSFLRSGLKKPAGRIFIEYPSPLLKKCRLVDTPGIDSSYEAGLLAEQAATEADQVIYLFHQRGIEDLNRLFLYKLAKVWKKKDLNMLSFWLNCNRGLNDGSSLESTRGVLREIFMSPVRCNTINTHNPASLEAVNLFLQANLARHTCRQAFKLLKKLDNELPGQINKAVRMKDDLVFLSEFWKAQETSQLILESGKLLNSLPSVSSKIEHILETANLINLGEAHKKPGGQVYRPKTTSVATCRNKLLALTGDLLAEKTIKNLIDFAAVENIACEIRAERFTVALLGGFSTGKTTFLNALLKENLFPTADGPTTTAVTRITYGPCKKATIHFPLQITMSICEQVQDKYGVYREQLQALERWLAPGSSDVAYVESSSEGSFQLLDRQEALKQVSQIKEYFAAGCFSQTATNRRVPGIFRLISPKAYKKTSFPEQIRVTFRDARVSEFDLSSESGREQFRKTLGPENMFRIEQVVVEHPSEYLRHADFLDTPGLDWIQKHHYQKTSSLIRHCNTFLIFLNGKHILNQMDQQNFKILFTNDPGTDFKFLPPQEKGKYFFVINFADTLNFAEQEAVCNFVRRNLGTPTGIYTPASGAPNIFLISALRAFSGDDTTNMSNLLKALEESIQKYRAKEFYMDKIAALLGILDEASLKAKALHEGGISGNGKVALRKARETLRDYRRRLKEIRSLISPAKPP